MKRVPAASSPARTVSRPGCGVCGSLVPKISRMSPEMSPARSSESVLSAPSLPSCRPVGYQHTVARTRASNAARKAMCPPVQWPAAPTFEQRSPSQSSAAETSASKSAVGVASASACPRALPSSSKPSTVPAGSIR